jgi:hypothetical protein
VALQEEGFVYRIRVEIEEDDDGVVIKRKMVVRLLGWPASHKAVPQSRSQFALHRSDPVRLRHLAILLLLFLSYHHHRQRLLHWVKPRARGREQ